jgi:hypothetical protein
VNTALLFPLCSFLPTNVVNIMAEELKIRRHGIFHGGLLRRGHACFELV